MDLFVNFSNNFFNVVNLCICAIDMPAPCLPDSEEEAKQKIYNVSCERYFGFGCEIDEETANKLEGWCLVFFVIIIDDIFFGIYISHIDFVSMQGCLVFCLSYLILMLILKTRTMEVYLISTGNQI